MTEIQQIDYIKTEGLDIIILLMAIVYTDNLITTKPKISKDRMCNRCIVIDDDNEDIHFTYSDESSVKVCRLFYKSLNYN